MLSSILLIVNHLKLAWNLLLNYSLFPNFYDFQGSQLQPGLPPGLADQLGIVRYKSEQQKQYNGEDNGDYGEEEEVGCAVCLCKIEEDDEMRELRCNHLFHKVCLDRWLGCSHSTTCPICRTSLSTPHKLIAGVQVLTFNYYTVTFNHRENWWLR